MTYKRTVNYRNLKLNNSSYNSLNFGMLWKRDKKPKL